MNPYLRSLRPVQMRLVAAIARHGQLSLAADMCSMSLPAASRMLASMEAHLGVSLFERTAKGMRLTPAGQLLSRHARKLVHDVDQMAQELTAHLEGLGGSVRVGAVTGGALSAVIPAILELKHNAPLVEVSLEVSSSTHLMEELERGTYDFALCRPGAETVTQDFEIARAGNENVQLMVNRIHPLANVDRVSLEQLADYPWTMQDRGAPLRHAVESAFHDAGVHLPSNLIKTSSVVTIMALLRDSDVVAVVTREVAELLLSPPFSADLTLLPMDQVIDIEPYYLLRPRDQIMSAAAERLIRLIHQRLAV
ncbi:LysR family transcriptional regulator [Tropicimonas sp. IMCC6043]|uniref:LysR family transcriptional regulator n=1 Tax=Tropicimonas sp. IMCC6043 TaxID=2510645 RepID=UPI00101CA831|nr:LysR family transcriptional regulator [Tropicimonas sp. IMCC6043]RYH06218.1 LysR family transcriptional regulator [Tropicimonas sp. IMCC6043]